MDVGRTPADRLLQAALSGLSARQRVVADNVANVDTPGFKASRVEFEQALRRALGRIADRTQDLELAPVVNGLGGANVADEGAALLTPTVVQTVHTSRRLDGNNVDVEQEMLELAETNLSYNALAQLVSSRMQLLRTIVNDGRR